MEGSGTAFASISRRRTLPATALISKNRNPVVLINSIVGNSVVPVKLGSNGWMPAVFDRNSDHSSGGVVLSAANDRVRTRQRRDRERAQIELDKAPRRDFVFARWVIREAQALLVPASLLPE